MGTTLKKPKPQDGYQSHRGGRFLDPNDAADKDFIRSIVTPRQDADYDHVDSSNKHFATPGAPGSQASSKRPLPTYDIERLQRLAEETESRAKHRVDQPKSSRTYKPIYRQSPGNSRGSSKSSKPLNRSAEHEENRRMEAHRPKTLRVDERPDQVLADPSKRYDNRDSPLAKLDSRRQEVKRRKTGSNSDTDSPSPDKNNSANKERRSLAIQEDRPADFLERMMKYDYTDLPLPAKDVTTDKDRLTKQSNSHPDTNDGGKAGREYASGNIKRPSDVEGGKDDGQSGQNQTPTSSHKESRSREQQEAELRARLGRPRSPDVLSQRSSSINSEVKKLVPLVPESQKNDVYAKVNLDRMRQERKERHMLTGKGSAGTHASTPTNPDAVNGSELTSHPSGHSHDKQTPANGPSLSREKRHPKLDHKNFSYKPANAFPPQTYAQTFGKPDFKDVKSSNYGKHNGKADRSASSRPNLNQNPRARSLASRMSGRSWTVY